MYYPRTGTCSVCQQMMFVWASVLGERGDQSDSLTSAGLLKADRHVPGKRRLRDERESETVPGQLMADRHVAGKRL